MSVYKSNNVETDKPTNLGVQAKDPQSLVDYFSGINGLTQTFNASEYDAVVGFFQNKNFSKLSAETVAYIILTQAKIDNVAVFKILDTFNNLSVLQLNETIAEILNRTRYKTSVIGFKSERTPLNIANRNVKV
jgi:hypothetical protein